MEIVGGRQGKWRLIFRQAKAHNGLQRQRKKKKKTIMIYLLTAIGLSPGGSTHLHTNNTQNNTNNNRTTQIQPNVEECGPCPVFASFTLAFALQLRKKHGKTSVRVRKTSVRVQYTYYQYIHTLQNPYKHTHYKTHTHAHTHTHILQNKHKTTTVRIKTKFIQEKQHNGEKEQYLVSNVVNPQAQHNIFNRTFTSLHFTSLHFTSLHFTSLHKP